MKRMTSLGTVLTAGVVVFGAASWAQAASHTVYTDRSSWESAVASFTTEDFNSVPIGQLSTGVNTVGSIEIEITGPPESNKIEPGSDSLNINGTTFFQGEADTSGSDAGFPTLLFPSPITAFGGDWTETNTSGDLTMTFGGETLLFSDHFTGDGNGFLGVTTTSSFSEVEFGIEAASSNEIFGLDDLSYTGETGDFTALPTPAAAPAGLAMLGLLALRRRRERPAA